MYSENRLEPSYLGVPRAYAVLALHLHIIVSPSCYLTPKFLRVQGRSVRIPNYHHGKLEVSLRIRKHYFRWNRSILRFLSFYLCHMGLIILDDHNWGYSGIYPKLWAWRELVPTWHMFVRGFNDMSFFSSISWALNVGFLSRVLTLLGLFWFL